MSKLIEVELFWEGDGWYYANIGDSERLGGPFERIHAAWKQIDNEGLEVVRVNSTRSLRGYHSVRPQPPNAEKEKKAEAYYSSGQPPLQPLWRKK